METTTFIHANDPRENVTIAELSQTGSSEALSPSQVRAFMDCQMRWWFKYGLKVPDLATANMALGRAIHSSLGENFAQKVDTREDLPAEGVVALFREAWANEIEQTEFRDEEDQGRQMVQVRRTIEGCPRQVLHLRAKDLAGDLQEAERCQPKPKI